MRFDDSLRTVMAADTTSAFGAQSAWRQLVDLLGRRRVPPGGSALARLRELRSQVPASARAASARALTLADPPAELVAFLSEDEPAVASPVLRTARLSAHQWLALLPLIGPVGRAVLRSRNDLPDDIVRALEVFGTTDFTIEHDGHKALREIVPAVKSSNVMPASRVEDRLPQPLAGGQAFEIADLVERIESFQRVQERRGAATVSRFDRFTLDTDRRGSIVWVDAAFRSVLIGQVLDPARLRDRSGAVQLHVEGTSEAAGDWTISAVAIYAPQSGHLLGFRGVARRLSGDLGRAIEPGGLRGLVHELRTPTNAISGFAELIATEMLGVVAPVHRGRAESIGRDVRALIGAIDDLEMSARVDGNALQLAAGPIDLGIALVAAVRNAAVEDCVRIEADTDLAVIADERALDRLLVRLASLIATSGEVGRPLTVTARAGHGDAVVTWPWRLRRQDASLLGAEFALRLAHKLSRALGGRLITEPDRLTLHLPLSFSTQVQATTF